MGYRFFLSSSSEKLAIAKALESNLAAEGFEVTLWSREAHAASQYNLEALLAETATADFAVFVFVPDDEATVRGERVSIVRDNVVFEAGLFIGALGRDRCFIVQPVDRPAHVPTDLAGMTLLTFDIRRSDGNLRRSLGPVATSITEQARAAAGAAEAQFTDNDLKLLNACVDTSMPSNQAWKAFGDARVTWDDGDDRLCMRFLRLLQGGLIQCVGPTEVETTRRGNLLAGATNRV